MDLLLFIGEGCFCVSGIILDGRGLGMADNLICVKDFSGCDEGEKVCLEVVVRGIKEVDTTGKNYSQTYIMAEDRTGEIYFPIWRRKEDVETELCEGMMYRVYGTVGVYRNENQLKYIAAKIVDDTEENRKRIDPALTRGVTEENSKVFMYIIKNKFSDRRYKRYCEIAWGLGDVPLGVCEEDYRRRFSDLRRAWCSIRHHDNYEGGLMNHVVGTARIVLSLKAQYDGEGGAVGRYEKVSGINWDKLLLLCYIHDLEKVSEYCVGDNGMWDYNKDALVGHVVNGVVRLGLIDREVEEDLRLSFEEMESLKYSLLCHHGDWGGFEVKSAEDKIFHAVDLLDASIVGELRLE